MATGAIDLTSDKKQVRLPDGKVIAEFGANISKNILTQRARARLEYLKSKEEADRKTIIRLEERKKKLLELLEFQYGKEDEIEENDILAEDQIVNIEEYRLKYDEIREFVDYAIQQNYSPDFFTPAEILKIESIIGANGFKSSKSLFKISIKADTHFTNISNTASSLTRTIGSMNRVEQKIQENTERFNKIDNPSDPDGSKRESLKHKIETLKTQQKNNKEIKNDLNEHIKTVGKELTKIYWIVKKLRGFKSSLKSGISLSLKDDEEAEDYKPAKLRNKKEEVDKTMILAQLDEHAVDATAGNNVEVPKIESLSKYYEEDGTIKAENFHEFMSELTGHEVTAEKLADAEHMEILGQELFNRQVEQLDSSSKFSIETRLTNQLEEQPIRDKNVEAKVKHLKEDRHNKVKGVKSSLKVTLDQAFDPHLRQDGVISRRAKKIDGALFDTLADGNITSLFSLRKLEGFEYSLRGEVKEEVMRGVAKLGTKLAPKVQTVTRKIKKSKALSPFRSMKAFIITKKRKAKRKHKRTGLFGLAMSFIGKKIREAVGQVIKTGTRVSKLAVNGVRSTEAFSNLSSSRLGQGLSKASSGVFKQVKQIAGVSPKLRAKVDGGRNLLIKGKDGVLSFKNGAMKVLSPLGRGVNLASYYGSNFAKSLPKGAISGVAVYAALALNPATAALALPVAIGVGTTTTGLGFANRLFNAPQKGLFGPVDRMVTNGSFKGIRGFFMKHGSGVFKDPSTGKFMKDIASGTNAEELLSKHKNLFGSRLARSVSALNFGMTTGTIAMTIAALMGASPEIVLLAGAGGLIAGTAGSYLYQSLIGSRLAAGLLSNTVSRLSMILGHIPTMAVINTMYGNKIYSQLVENLAKQVQASRGAGMGLAWKQFSDDNLEFNGANLSIQNLIVLNNYIGLMSMLTGNLAVTRAVFGQTLLALSKNPSFFANSKGIMDVLKLGPLGKGAFSANLFSRAGLAMRLRAFLLNPVALGSLTGSIAGLAIASIIAANFGLVIGPAALLGATIGTVVGTGIGIIASGFLTVGSSGFLSWATFGIVTLTTTIGTAIGTLIGSKFDTMISKAVSGLLGVVSGISFLFSFLDILRNGLKDMTQLATLAISFALILPSLGAALNSGTKLQVSNNCIEQTDENKCQDETTISETVEENNLEETSFNPGRYQQHYLSNYGVYLITPQGEQINYQNLIKYLDSNPIQQEKDVYIAVSNSKSRVYDDNDMLLLVVNYNLLENTTLLTNTLDSLLEFQFDTIASN